MPSNSLGGPGQPGVKGHGRCVRPCQPAMRHDAGLAQPWASRRVERGRGDAQGEGEPRGAPSWASHWRFVLAARHGRRAVLRLLGPPSARSSCETPRWKLGDGLSRCMEAVTQITLRSGASICDGTTYLQSGRTSQPSGTTPAPGSRIANRLPPLRFLSFPDAFMRQPPWNALRGAPIPAVS